MPGTGDGATLMLNGHIDVVPIGDPDAWDAQPFAAETRGSRLFGRGACDMKAGLVAALWAAEAIRTAGVRLRGDLLLASVQGEEDGGLGTFATLRRGWRADACVIPEPTSLAMIPANSGALTFRLRVRGLATHAARRTEGVSAIEKFWPLHRALTELERRRHEGVDPRMARWPLAHPISIGTVHAGDWASSVPDLLVAEGRFGVAIGESVADARRDARGRDRRGVRRRPVVAGTSRVGRVVGRPVRLRVRWPPTAIWSTVSAARTERPRVPPPPPTCTAPRTAATCACSRASAASPRSSTVRATPNWPMAHSSRFPSTRCSSPHERSPRSPSTCAASQLDFPTVLPAVDDHEPGAQIDRQREARVGQAHGLRRIDHQCTMRSMDVKRSHQLPRLALACALFIGCGSRSGDGFDVIADRQSGASYVIDATVPEMLADPTPYDLTIVEGSIARIDDGVGMVWTLDENGENEQRQFVTFTAVDAMARSVHVTIDVGRVVAGDGPEASPVRFGLVVDDVADARALRDGLVGQTVIAFLTASPVFDYEAELYGVVMDGGLLCRRGDEAALECPALDEGLRQALAVGSVTATDLEGVGQP